MKQKIAQILVIAMAICTTAFAGKNDDKVNWHVLTEFSQKFSGAKDVKWSSTANYSKASFVLDGQALSAYFTNTGEVLGTARNLVTNQLPSKLQAELKKNFAEGWVTELFAYSTDEDTTFYVTIETADQKVSLKNDDSNWTLIKKTKKN